jgi:hypothetical protein
MKALMKLLAVVVCVGWMVQEGFAQVTIHYWNFNTIDTLSNGDWVSPIPATTGSGSLTHEFVGVKPFSGTTVNAEGSDLSGSAFCPQGGTSLVNNGKNLTLSLPTTGYQNLIFSYATRRTSTGFDTQEILYSLDGTTFISDTVMTGILSTGFEPTPRVVNFSDVTGANNNPNFKIKIIVNGASGATGNNRFDNVKIQGFLPTLNDGDGSATLVNNVGTFSGSTIFSRNTSGQTVLVTITGVPAGNLDRVRLTVPSDWGGFSGSNVTVGGAFAGNTPVIAGNQITINSAALGTTPGTIQISSLTSSNPVGALNNGNSIWTVETATSSGTLTPIATSPRSHTIIPIQNIRTGGVDGFGNSDAGGLNSAMNGQTVAVQGVATVQNLIVSSTSTQTSFFIQDGGFGVQIFRFGAPVVTWVRGDNIVVRGGIETFDGSTEVVPQTGSSPDFYNLGAGVLPSPLILTNANSISEQHEGKLVGLNSVTWDSAGQTFIAAGSPRNSFRTAPTDTGSLFLTSTNPIVGTVIPTSSSVAGIVYHRNGLAGPMIPPHRLVARDLVDLGFDPADGTGTATITPAGRLQNQVAVAETLTVTGNGTNTLGGVQVTIPSSWTWDGTSFALSGAGFSGATPTVTGVGTAGNPWVITVSGASVTDVNTGTIRMFNMNTPSAIGLTTFLTKTRGASGTFANIASSPTVNIGSAFEAVQSGNWSSSGTWAGGVVPTASDNVTMSTLGVVVIIDVSNAQCNNLTMTGSGTDTTGGGSGPVLRFADTGSPALTVNGSLSISGGSGGGNGNRGGRPQLTSNGNPNAVLVVKKNLFSSSSNSVLNGNAGMNMHEGTVKLTGSTADTLRFGAGMRLGHLEIGDGAVAKTVRTFLTTSVTMNIVSLNVRQGSTFLIGTQDNTFLLTVGNFNTAGIPFLNGGITVESGATLQPQISFTGLYTANINLKGGGITNNGTLNLLSFGLSPNLTHCTYTLNISGAVTQTVGGSNTGTYADVVVASGDTLILQQDMDINFEFEMTLNGVLAETPGNTVTGAVEATRTVSAATLESFGGMGLELNAAGNAPGQTLARRVTGVPQFGGGNSSILRYFDITPTVNTGLNATLRYFYDNTELAGQNPLTLQLWKSIDGGSTWTAQGGSVDTALHRVEVTGVNELSRWTASDANNPLVGGGTVTLSVPVTVNWNIVSLPVSSPVPGDSVLQVFVNSVNPYGFRFQNGYVQSFTLANGPGYWIKSSQTYNQDITGFARDTLTVPVSGGWNMIGSISTQIDTSVAHVTPSVAGLRTSAFFKYQAGYVIATTIDPGFGYWVKTSQAGSFFMHVTGPAAKPQAAPGRSIEELNTITIADANGGSQTLYFGADATGEIPSYDLPPLPPAGSFDARFTSAEGGMMVKTHPVEVSGVIEVPIAIQSSAYPLTVTWKVNGTDAVYELSGEGLAQTLQGEGTLRINGSDVNRLTLRVMGSGSGLPKEYALYQNYPNPFNPTTSIKFALPVESKVRAEIYNILGQRVATLVNEVIAAGYHTVEWNGTNASGQSMGSGVYFVRLAAEGKNGKSFTEVKKLLLLK